MQKYNIFGINYTATDYEEATALIIFKSVLKQSFGVSALAVHGLIECNRNQKLSQLINKIDLIVPDGQPIKWAINSFYGYQLSDRVYGPDLTEHVLTRANHLNLNIYLYGSTENTLNLLCNKINTTYSNINICGLHVDRFRDSTHNEDLYDINKINRSNPHIVLVGRGCPRQEIWVSQHLGKINAVMMAVGAAFDFHAGTLKQAPKWMQDKGLEWFYRLCKEPKRLWKRYLFTNSYFIYLFIKHKYILRRPY